ncbi:MAG: exodeoxyribonuclease III [Tepidimonas ignava]|uniref:exodeoxyribonuclease III n=1 Tax=Tepidimonas ignava TaxID=114249 RepID=UPI00391D2CDC
MQLATWNVNSLNVRLPQLLQWLAQRQPDIVALQELKLRNEAFPLPAVQAAGYDAVWLGQKAYNGVALLVRQGAQLCDVQRNLPNLDDAQARLIAATVQLPGTDDALRVVGAYFPNGQAPGSDKFVYKMQWLDALRAWLATQLNQHPKLVLMGDFNITRDDLDVWDPVGLRETIHCTAAEREQLQALLALGLQDALRTTAPQGGVYTWWDYRQLAFPKNRGLRIDHILLSTPLHARLRTCEVDRAMRKRPQPSDHAPVVATLDLD